VSRSGLPLDDCQLMNELKRGDEAALEELIARHERRLFRIIYLLVRDPAEAKDLLQETFIRVFTRSKNWEPKAQPITWITRIAVNLALDKLRKRKRDKEIPINREKPSSRPSPHRILWGKEVGRLIERAINSLPDGQREIFILKHFEDLSLKEIAEIRACALGTVKASLHQAVIKIRETLKEQGVVAI
jgi:RNA polymerase sigma-70 factor (ECF subfamily)